MDALKKIEKQADDHSRIEDYWCQVCGWDGAFLLKAFKVIREIAIQNKWGNDAAEMTMTNGEMEVDKKFNERMEKK